MNTRQQSFLDVWYNKLLLKHNMAIIMYIYVPIVRKTGAKREIVIFLFGTHFTHYMEIL